VRLRPPEKLAGPPTIELDERAGETVVWLDNGLVRVGCTPYLGGRTLSISVGSEELLYRNAELVAPDLHRAVPEASLPPQDGTMPTWRNVGGDKTWPAPQGWDGPGQWPGPPDEVLDSGAFAYTTDVDGASASVEMRSGADPWTGLQLTRRVTVHADVPGLALDLAFTNVSEEAVSWSLWNVTQVAGASGDAEGEGLYVGVEPGGASSVIDMFALTERLQRREPVAGVLHVPPHDVVGKIGIPAATGWLAYLRRDTALVQLFDVDEDATYPDGGSRVEVWMQAPFPEPFEQLAGWVCDAYVVECEVLAPLVTLEPGATSRQHIEFRAVGGEGGAVEQVAARFAESFAREHA